MVEARSGSPDDEYNLWGDQSMIQCDAVPPMMRATDGGINERYDVERFPNDEGNLWGNQ